MYRPWTTRRFGVEMEMNEVTVARESLPARTIHNAITSAIANLGLPANRVSRSVGVWGRSDGSTWDVKTDSSCGFSGAPGWEVASPAMLLNDEAECPELRDVTAALEALRPRIDRHCGLHVHVEVRDFDWADLRRLLILWVRYEPFFFELCPPSRSVGDHGRTYCPPFRKSTWDGTEGDYWTRIEESFASQNARGFRQALEMGTPRGSLNLAHFWTNQRIEFRLGAGTVNYEKIVRWVQLLLSLVQIVKVAGAQIRAGQWSDKGFPVSYMARMLRLAPGHIFTAEECPPESAALVAWMEARCAKFKRADADDTTLAPAAPPAPARRTRAPRPTLNLPPSAAAEVVAERMRLQREALVAQMEAARRTE